MSWICDGILLYFSTIKPNRMDLKLERASLIKELERVEDVSLIRTLKKVLQNGLNRESRVNLDTYNKELEQADSEIEAGHFLVHEEAAQLIRSWREK